MSSEEVLESDEARGGGRLCLRFTRRADRVSQSLEWLAGDRRTTLLVSCEGEAGEDWPPSPPLQQLLIEPRGASGNVALLVGMAGRSHWSLSVEPIAGRAAFLFDAACRLNAPPTWLGHVWRAAGGDGVGRPAPSADGGVGRPAPSADDGVGRPAPSADDAGSISWRIGAGVLRVAGEPSTDGAGLVVCEARGGECRLAAVIPAGRFPVTGRWRFVVEYTE